MGRQGVTGNKNVPQVNFMSRNAVTCGGCGRSLDEDETVWLPRVLKHVWFGYSYRKTAMCAECGEHEVRAADLLARERRLMLPGECAACGRGVVYQTPHKQPWERRHVFCCEKHSRAFYNRFHNERRKAEGAKRRKKICESCGKTFTAARRDAKHCTAACKQRAYRERKKAPVDYPYVWAWAKRPRTEWGAPGSYKSKRCRVLARSRRMNSVALEFEDGYRVITSRNGIRKAK